MTQDRLTHFRASSQRAARRSDFRLRSWHAIAELENDIGAGLLTTVVAYRDVSIDISYNNTATPFDGVILPDNYEDNHQYSLETRYNVPFTDGVDLTTGLFLLRSEVGVTERRRVTGPIGAPLPYRYVQGRYDQTTSSVAGFANIDWTIRPGPTLAAGGRYSSDKKTIDFTPLLSCPNSSFVGCTTNPQTRSRRWGNFSPRSVLSWQATPRILAFASYSQGFRSGNFNGRVSDAAGVGVGPADPETAKAYELGIKSDLFDRTLRVNVSVFQTDYSSIQQVVTIPGLVITQALTNVADARIRGAEAEVTLRPVRALTLTGSVGYIDAVYRSFNRVIPGVANPLVLNLPKVPKWTAVVAANYTHDLPGLRGSLDLRVAYDYRSSFATDFANTAGLRADGYGLTNANLTFQRDRWSISTFVRNLFDVDYVDTKARNFAYIAYGGQPRTYGVRMTTRF